MAKKEIKLDENIIHFNFNLPTSNILVYSDNIKKPLVRSSVEFNVEKSLVKGSKEYDVVNITPVAPKNNNIRIKGNVIKGNSRVIVGGGDVIIVDGKVISGNILINNYEDDKVELIVPKTSGNLTFHIRSVDGNVTLKDLIMARLMIKTINGNITLNDIDVFVAKLSTVNGNIRAEIIESMINYSTFLKTVNGNVVEKTIGAQRARINNEKNQFEAKSVNGNIRVLFKG